MKQILLTVMFLICFKGFAAEEVKLPVDEKGNIVYTEVVEVPDVTKDVLYARASEWIAKTYKSAKSVIQLQDKENGKIVAKGLSTVTVKSLGTWDAGWVNHTLTLAFKDGKYKYEITGFFHEGSVDRKIGTGGNLELEKPACGNPFTGGGITKGWWRSIKEQTDKSMKDLIVDLKKFVTEDSAKNDKW